MEATDEFIIVIIKTPKKLKTALIKIDLRTLRQRVVTQVAIALGASVQPLTKTTAEIKITEEKVKKSIKITSSRLHTMCFAKMQTKIDALNNTVQENLTNVRVVKSFVRQDYEEKKFKASSAEIANDFINLQSGTKMCLHLNGKKLLRDGPRGFGLTGTLNIMDTVGGGRMMAKSSSGSGYTGGVVIIKNERLVFNYIAVEFSLSRFIVR